MWAKTCTSTAIVDDGDGDGGECGATELDSEVAVVASEVLVAVLTGL